MQPATNLVDHSGNTIGTDWPVNHLDTTNWNTLLQSPPDTEDESVAEETRLILSKEFEESVEMGFSLDLEPITTENLRCQYTGKAKSSFQGHSRERLFGYLDYCIYLSSNNHLTDKLTENLVSLISKSRALSLLKRILKSNDIAVEIFTANLLGSAAKLGEVEICDVLIQAGADIDSLTGGYLRETALCGALGYGKIACAKLLLIAGADPNLPAEQRFPIQHACLSRTTSLEGVILLRSFGAAVSPPVQPSQLSPLQWAIGKGEFELAKYLLEDGADPNFFPHPKSGTPLQLASVFFETSTVTELLLKAGAKINAPVHSGDQRIHSHVSGREESEDDSNSDSGSDSDSCLGCDLSDQHFIYGENMSLAESVSFPFMSPILIAAINRNWETVQFLLDEGADINPSWRSCKHVLEKKMSSRNISVFTPLQAAVLAENVTMTRMLLGSGAHIDARARGNQGHTALQIAAMVGSKRIIELLLARGADINAPAGIYYGKTALQGAARLLDTTVLRLLLKAGADVNAAPSKRGGKTALHFAVSVGNIEAVELLLDSRAALNLDPNLTYDGAILADAIHLCDPAIRKEIVHLLTRAWGHIELPKGKSNHAPLQASIKCGHLEMTRQLLEKGVSPNLGYCAKSHLTPLQEASAREDPELVELLIEYGANINAPAGARSGRTALQAAVETGNLSIINLLLKHGADIKAPSAYPEGISVIEAAVEDRDTELVGMLLEKCPDAITSQPKIKHGILDRGLAARDISLVDLLLKAGASTGDDKCYTHEISVLQLAVHYGFDIFQCILSACANPSQRWLSTCPGEVTAIQAAASYDQIDMVRDLLKKNADVNTPANSYGGVTALQAAVSRGNFEMVRLLIRHGADVNGLPSPVRGRTALQMAAQKGFVKLTEYLMACGAHVNAAAASNGGVTAIQAAAIGGYIRIVEILLQHGARVNGAPAIEEGRTAIEGAAEHGRLRTLQLLLEKHPDTEDFDIRRKRAARFAQANGRVAIERYLLAYRKQPQI